MLKRVNWYLLFSVFFVVFGVLFLLQGDWLQGVWSVALGGGYLMDGGTLKPPGSVGYGYP